ncbi:sterol 26-hydroxylase, mitochondrial-like [Anneissia japonica]|uniref:sterol 26-hydroxylase, mitochondrial-like n=1 Tax=Anneissia japonica TaxID=1529436 RepID=UPI001425B147|nr:sterol 26-hydroxylase, mitochondrial-like [Anneissia japonica]
MLRYTNTVVVTASTPLIRRFVHLENGPYLTHTKHETQEKVKAFDEIPTRNANILQAVFDMIYLKRKGLLTRSDLVVQENADKYGPIMRNFIGNQFIVQIVDPILVEKVFRAEGKYPQRMDFKPWKEYRAARKLPLGLFLQDGEAWHKSRQAIGKRILKPIAMAPYLPAMKNITDEMIGRLRRIQIKEGEKKDIMPDLEEELFKWSMEGVTMVLLDHRLGLLSDKIDKQSQSFIDATHEIFATTLELFLFNDFHKRFNTKLWQRHVAAWDTSISLTKNLIQHRVEDFMSAKEKGSEVKEDTFLGALIANSDLTQEEIFGNLSELIGAAIDTTSYTFLWTLYLLAHNPDAQAKLHKEICDALPVGKQITQEDLAKLVYMKMVIKEALRMNPVVTGLSRKLENDIVLNGYHIPAKTTIAVQFYPMLKNPNYFEDPLDFRPERWDRTKKNSKDVNAFASIPFGFGTRMCIGRRFAEQEMHLLLAEIIRQFDVVPTKTVGITTKLVVIPDEPVDLKFIDRH